MTFLPSIGDGKLLDIYKAFPETWKLHTRYEEMVMRGPSPLTPGQRETIAAVVSGLNKCHWCHGVHTKVAERLGVTEGVIPDLVEDVESGGIEEALKPILRFVKKLTANPSTLSQADAEAVFASGWDEQALHDAVLVCAVFNHMNRVVLGLGIMGDDTDFKGVSLRLVRRGYAVDHWSAPGQAQSKAKAATTDEPE